MLPWGIPDKTGRKSEIDYLSISNVDGVGG